MGPVVSSRRSRSRWLLPLAMLLLVGCGSRVAPGSLVDQADEGWLVSSAGTAASEVPPPPSVDATTAETSQSVSAFGDPGTGPVEQPSMPPSPVKLYLSSDCYEPGEIVNVLVKAPPRAGLALSSAFEGWDHPGPHFLGTANDQGEFHWTVPVPPGTRPGLGFIGAASTGPDFGQGGGVDQARFRVTAPGGCP